jgi:hypothetical protein
LRPKALDKGVQDDCAGQENKQEGEGVEEHARPTPAPGAIGLAAKAVYGALGPQVNRGR